MVKTSKLILIAWTLITGFGLVAIAAPADAACPQVGFTIVEPSASSITRPVSVGKNQTIFVRRVPLTTTGDIVEIRLVQESAGDNEDDADLLIKFTSVADQKLHDATTNHSGRRIAFMFNDELLLNVVWEGRYGMDPGGTRVSMHHGMKRLPRLMQAIRGCTSTDNLSSAR